MVLSQAAGKLSSRCLWRVVPAVLAMVRCIISPCFLLPSVASPPPRTLVALKKASALISAARSAAAVSVVKNGLPVPAPKMTTRPCSRWRIARRLR